MTITTRIIYLVGALLLLSFLTLPTFAAHTPNPKANIPEQNGTFDDPDHPGVKVRVFVHREKPATVTASALMCELADPDSAAQVSAAGWHLPSNWSYNLNPSSVPSSVGSTNLANLAANGFADWTGAVGNKVTSSRGADSTVTRSAYDLKNIIAWGRTSGSALGVTYIRYFTSSGLVVDVDTIMNKKFPWRWSNSSTCAYSEAYDAENILTHEIGHWFGLDDETDTSFLNATMYGFGSKGEVKKNTLTTGDVSGAAAIYP